MRVMAGDKLEVSALSYWEEDTGDYIYATPNTMIDNLFSTLAAGEMGNYQPENSSYIQAMSDAQSTMASNMDAYQDIVNGITNPDAPRAYINYGCSMNT